MSSILLVPLSTNEHFPQALVMSLCDFLSHTKSTTMHIEVKKRNFLEVYDLCVSAFRNP